MKTKLFFLLGAIISLSAAAQKWTDYSETNGLVNNYVYSITSDVQGNTWVGTNGGISKFDGINWTNYTIANSGLATDRVNAITIDKLGNKWIGTWGGGVSKFDGVNWTTYLDYSIVSDIAIDVNENIWFCCGGRLAKFDGTNWFTYYSDFLAVPQSLAIDTIGNIWVETSFDGLVKFDGTNWTNYTTANSGLPHDNVSSIAIDTIGNLWLGTGTGLSKFDGIKWTNFPGLPLNDIAIDTMGYIWDAIGGFSGVNKFDGTNWITYINPIGFTCDYICVNIDAQGNKWYGTYGNGIFKLEDIVTGLPHEEIKNEDSDMMSVYPNPLTNETTVLFPSPDKYTLNISDLNGKIVKPLVEIEGERSILKTVGLVPGIYLLSAKNRTNGLIYKGKIVISK
jgi:streptogramin lyase